MPGINNMMRAGKRTQTFSPNSVVSSGCGRNLEKYQLGGVIFGCKRSTMKECQSKQLFGLPAQHFSYVKNIDPGLPIFLFNYSDRKLHGIFEASSKGKMYIDPYAWIDDYSELDRTQYPAQVKFRVRLQCQPLSEDKFAKIIADNYYSDNHFWFELDHRQTNKLISLLASLAFATGCNMKWKTVPPSLPPTLKEGKTSKISKSKTQHLTSSNKRTGSTVITSLDGDIKPLDTQAAVKEVNDNEMKLIYLKLKELALGHESKNLSVSDNLNDTPGESDMCNVDKPADLEEKEESSNPPVEHQNNIGQREAELKIQHLMDRCTMLESAFNLHLTRLDQTVVQSSEQDADPKGPLFLKVNFDGESWLSTMNLYCPSQNVIRSLYPMNSAHSYTSIMHPRNSAHSHAPIMLLNGEAYVFWYQNDTEVLNLDTGRWISAHSMLDKGIVERNNCGCNRFVLAEEELNVLLYSPPNETFDFDESKINGSPY
ncbi:hypothetical protein CR513_38822, partial [Mucuna pruriens]